MSFIALEKQMMCRPIFTNFRLWCRSGFFWQGDNHRKKYRLAKWGLLCLPKEQGGLGILNLEAQNTCLLSKWLYKLINEDRIQLLRKKYLKNKTISEVFWKRKDSHFLSGLIKGKDQKKHSSVAHVISTNPLNISFRRALVGDKLIKSNDLVARIAFVQLDGQHDKAIWSLTKYGYFTVKSLYNFSVNQSALPLNKKLWKLKLPLKIKIFAWFLMKCVILTKDNLKKRNWNGDDGCCFCNEKETIQHLFFDCHVARFVIFRGTYWTTFWSQLQKEDDRNHLKWACRLLETVAFEMFAKN
ncbi:hypothetical protein U9M48_006322, partial [Paspalum notatum var. saurae]